MGKWKASWIRQIRERRERKLTPREVMDPTILSPALSSLTKKFTGEIKCPNYRDYRGRDITYITRNPRAKFVKVKIKDGRCRLAWKCTEKCEYNPDTRGTVRGHERLWSPRPREWETDRSRYRRKEENVH